MKHIGEDVSEKLDCTPGVFHIERHIRGKWACAECRRSCTRPCRRNWLTKASPRQALAHAGADGEVCRSPSAVSPGSLFERVGLTIPRSTLAQWIGACGVHLQPLLDARKAVLLERVLHADKTPMAMQSPGKGKTCRA
jgi:transposase